MSINILCITQLLFHILKAPLSDEIALTGQVYEILAMMAETTGTT